MALQEELNDKDIPWAKKQTKQTILCGWVGVPHVLDQRHISCDLCRPLVGKPCRARQSSKLWPGRWGTWLPGVGLSLPQPLPVQYDYLLYAEGFHTFCLIISQCRVLHAPSPALLWAQGVDTHNGMLLKAPLIIATSCPASEELATYFEIRQLRSRGCNHMYSKCSQNLNPGLSDSS